MSSSKPSYDRWVANVTPGPLYFATYPGVDQIELSQDLLSRMDGVVKSKLRPLLLKLQTRVIWHLRLAYVIVLIFVIQTALSLSYDYPTGTAIFTLVPPSSFLFGVAVAALVKLPNMVETIRPDYTASRILLSVACAVLLVANVVLNTVQLVSFCASGSKQITDGNGYKTSCQNYYPLHIVACVFSYINLAAGLLLLLLEILVRSSHRDYSNEIYTEVVRETPDTAHPVLALLRAMSHANSELNAQHNYDTSSFVAYYFPVSESMLRTMDHWIGKPTRASEVVIASSGRGFQSTARSASVFAPQDPYNQGNAYSRHTTNSSNSEYFSH